MHLSRAWLHILSCLSIVLVRSSSSKGHLVTEAQRFTSSEGIFLERRSVDSNGDMAQFGLGKNNGLGGVDGLQDTRQRTQQPIVTGTTILGLKYKDGVMLAADTLASYGSMARYKDVRRIKTVGDNTIIGASGEMSDFQAVMKKLENMDLEDLNQDDGYKRSPSEVFNFLRSDMYQRRNKGDPLWNQLIVAGHKNDAAFLGYVDLIGKCAPFPR